VAAVHAGDHAGRAVLATVLRSLAAVAVLIAAYYWAPLDRGLDAGTALLFVAALLLFLLFMAVNIRAILASSRPRLRAVRALAVGIPILLVVFAATYCIVQSQQPGAFTQHLSRTDGLYFTVTVFATVGFGDIAPVSELARVLVTFQMLLDLVAVGVIAKVVFGVVDVAVHRTDKDPAGAVGGDRQ